MKLQPIPEPRSYTEALDRLGKGTKTHAQFYRGAGSEITLRDESGRVVRGEYNREGKLTAWDYRHG